MEKPEMHVNNVVSSYSTRCHLNLRKIAMEGMHVEYKKENNMVNMKLRKPYTTATIWSSGKITCAGAKSESEAYKAARRFCRLLQKMKFRVRLTNYRIVNVLATCAVPFSIDILRLADCHRKECSYEPELHPGATYKFKDIKTTLKLFTTGSITLTAPSVQLAQEAIHRIHPIVLEFKRGATSTSATSLTEVKFEPIETKIEPTIAAEMEKPRYNHVVNINLPLSNSHVHLNSFSSSTSSNYLNSNNNTNTNPSLIQTSDILKNTNSYFHHSMSTTTTTSHNNHLSLLPPLPVPIHQQLNNNNSNSPSHLLLPSSSPLQQSSQSSSSSYFYPPQQQHAHFYQPSPQQNWFYDNLGVDSSVDDFLP